MRQTSRRVVLHHQGYTQKLSSASLDIVPSFPAAFLRLSTSPFVSTIPIDLAFRLFNSTHVAPQFCSRSDHIHGYTGFAPPPSQSCYFHHHHHHHHHHSRCSYSPLASKLDGPSHLQAQTAHSPRVLRSKHHPKNLVHCNGTARPTRPRGILHRAHELCFHRPRPPAIQATSLPRPIGSADYTYNMCVQTLDAQRPIPNARCPTLAPPPTHDAQSLEVAATTASWLRSAPP